MFRIESIRIIPPRKGACRWCGQRHAKTEGHTWNSLVYLHRFYWRYKRLPTEEDARGTHEMAQP